MSSHAARTHTRALLMQAHYQHQLTDTPLLDLLQQFEQRDEHARVDAEYFEALLRVSIAQAEVLDEEIVTLAQRGKEQLGPVEIAILRVALTELRERIDIPFRVVINEAVAVARRFAAEDAHKFVNAVLDRAARQHRAAEQQAQA
ncbi:MAG: transcription antitermination factor NusB [Pseudomonadota bacterium]